MRISFPHLLVLQTRKARRSINFKMVSLLFCLLFCLTFITNVLPLAGNDVHTVASAARQWERCEISQLYLTFVLPLFSSLAFSNEILSAKENHSLQFLLTRMDRKRYYLATGLVAFGQAFLINLVFLLLSQLLWLIACPVTSQQPLTQFVHTEFEGVGGLLFSSLFFNSPYLYNLLYMLLLSLLSGAFAFFSSGSCFFLQNSLQVFLLPVLVYLAEDFISGAIGKEYLAISRLVDPLPASPGLSIAPYVVFITALMLVGALFFLYGLEIKKDEF